MGLGALARANLDELYDAYLNCFFRSLKAWRRGDELGGRMQAAESCLYLVRLLFAAGASSWRRYHDQLRGPLRELEQAAGLGRGIPRRRAATACSHTGDPSFQQELELRRREPSWSRAASRICGVPRTISSAVKEHRFA